MNAFWSVYSESTKMWQGIAQSSLDTTETLQHRLAMLCGMKAPPPDSSLHGEIDLMVSEKLRAVTDGIMDASWQTMLFCLKSGMGELDMTSATRAGLAISQAGLKPAQEAVRSNARRLSMSSAAEQV